MLTTTLHGRLDLLRNLGRGILLVSLVQLSLLCFGIRLNTTASLPIGLYMQCSAPNAQLVEFCPPQQPASLALSRGYRSVGVCPDGGEPLLKPVVATSGDVVIIHQQGILINSKLLPNSRPRSQDSLGRNLAHWPLGVYKVPNGALWVVSTFDARIFDSRYFGPISSSSVRAHLKPLITE